MDNSAQLPFIFRTKKTFEYEANMAHTTIVFQLQYYQYDDINR